MTDIDALAGRSDGWHVPPALARAYLAGRVADEQAWSVEAHVLECATCRTVLADDDVVPAPVAALVDGVAGRLTTLPAQVPLPRATGARRAVALLGLRQLGLSWAVGVVTVLAVAALLDRTIGTAGMLETSSAGLLTAWFFDGGSWVALVAPFVPVAGVALAYGHGLDPGAELVASTPFAGLRITLWRTATVLLVATPLSLAGQAATVLLRPPDTPPPHLAAWLLPALALTVLTLAVGSVTGTTLAAALVAGGWFAGAVAPVLAGTAPLLLVAVPTGAWPTLTVAAAAVLVLRRDHLTRLLLTLPGRPA